MSLELYLNKHFQTFSKESLSDHFKSIGVDVHISGDLYQFKYDQIEAKWNEEITHFCRGAILEFSNNSWKYIARPWNKFFNRTELLSGFSKNSDINLCLNGEFRQKLDGSCIILYFYKDSWKASTLGSIETSEVNDFGFTFSELFWKLFGKDTSDLIPGRTYLFELCTVYNRIVTKYKEDHVTYLGCLSNQTGEALESNLSSRFPVPLSVKFCPARFKSWIDVKDFVEEESSNEIYGENSEGFVFYQNGLPKYKEKNRKYVHLHHVLTGDKMFVKKNLIKLFFEDGLDDVYDDLPEMLLEFVENLRKKYVQVSENIYHALKDLEQHSERKDFALAVQKLDSELKNFSGYFFEWFLSKKTFSEWLKSKNKNGKFQYEAGIDFWKES